MTDSVDCRLHPLATVVVSSHTRIRNIVLIVVVLARRSRSYSERRCSIDGGEGSSDGSAITLVLGGRERHLLGTCVSQVK